MIEIAPVYIRPIKIASEKGLGELFSLFKMLSNPIDADRIQFSRFQIKPIKQLTNAVIYLNSYTKTDSLEEKIEYINSASVVLEDAKRSLIPDNATDLTPNDRAVSNIIRSLHKATSIFYKKYKAAKPQSMAVTADDFKVFEAMYRLAFIQNYNEQTAQSPALEMAFEKLSNNAFQRDTSTINRNNQMAHECIERFCRTNDVPDANSFARDKEAIESAITYLKNATPFSRGRSISAQI